MAVADPRYHDPIESLENADLDPSLLIMPMTVRRRVLNLLGMTVGITEVLLTVLRQVIP
jgi:hypothetical protein